MKKGARRYINYYYFKYRSVITSQRDIMHSDIERVPGNIIYIKVVYRPLGEPATINNW